MYLNKKLASTASFVSEVLWRRQKEVMKRHISFKALRLSGIKGAIYKKS